MFGTTKGNCEGYTNYDIAAATEARLGLAMVGNTLMGDYINIIHSILICNCPITPEAVTITSTIFDPDIATVKGGTTRKYYEPVVTDYRKIPQLILDLNQELTLVAGVIFLNGI